MRRLTHREFLMWDKWLEERWNNPDLSCHYLAQIALEVRRVLHQKPASVSLNDMLLKFTKPKPVVPLTPDEATKIHRAGWMSWLGMKAPNGN